MDKRQQIIDECFKKVIDNINEDYNTVLKSSLYDSLKFEDFYRRHIDDIWGCGLNLYEFYLNCTKHYCDQHFYYLDQYLKIDFKTAYKFYDIRYLNGRALQIASEILVLMKNGFVDVAYAKFRTIYEIVVTAKNTMRY